jgi:hypothetical protein
MAGLPRACTRGYQQSPACPVGAGLRNYDDNSSRRAAAELLDRLMDGVARVWFTDRGDAKKRGEPFD